jgi:hypothetical protein
MRSAYYKAMNGARIDPCYNGSIPVYSFSLEFTSTLVRPLPELRPAFLKCKRNANSVIKFGQGS